MTRITLANPSNKYGARRTEYKGRVYHSKKEAEYAMQLDLRMRAGDIVGWSAQIPYRLEVNGELICKYIMDFVVSHNDGTIELVEIKGFSTSVYRLKAKLLNALYIKDDPRTFYTVVK